MMSSWSELHRKHKGETGLVIGNGPSLNEIPLDFLWKYPSFGTNKIYLLENFTPTYYCAVNPLVIEQVANRVNADDYEAMFITEAYTKHLLTNALPLYSSVIPAFSRNPAEWIYEGYTVTYVCLQLAFFMGFDTVLLVGCDHSYEFEGRPNEMKLAWGEDKNHFHPEYFSNGNKWHNPDLIMSEGQKDSKPDYRISFRCVRERRLQGMVKLTCLLSTYHDLPLLQGRLDNLLTQDGDVEGGIIERSYLEIVFIAEDGSEEWTVIDDWTIAHPDAFRWRCVGTDGIPTLYDAWNQGIAIASGEYLTNTNTDDRLYPGALQRMIDILDNEPDVGVVYPDVHRVAEIDGEPFGTYTWAEGDFDVLVKGCFLGPMPMWRKSLHDEHGMFDPEMHSSGDYDFWLRIAKAGVKMKRIPEPLGAYFDRKESIEHREPIRTVWETANARSRYRENP
jgi:hypothetical protein